MAYQKDIQIIHDSLTEVEIETILNIVNKHGTETSDIDKVQLRRDLEKLVYDIKVNFNPSRSSEEKMKIINNIRRNLIKL